MRAEKFCSRRSQKVSVPTVNSISNDKHTGTGQEKGRKTARRQGSQIVEVCHGEVLKAKLRGFETEGDKLAEYIRESALNGEVVSGHNTETIAIAKSRIYAGRTTKLSPSRTDSTNGRTYPRPLEWYFFHRLVRSV